MTIATEERLYTIPEFLALDLADQDAAEYELIGGRLVAKPRGSTSGRHGEVVFKLSRYLGNYLDSNPVGKGYAEASCTLGEDEGLNYPRPDVCFVAAGRAPADFDGPIPVAPDLVIEVDSPTDTDERRIEKLQAYQQAGVKLVWSVRLLEKYMIVYRLNQARSFLDLSDELDGEQVLPGFKLKVSQLFS